MEAVLLTTESVVVEFGQCYTVVEYPIMKPSSAPLELGRGVRDVALA